MYSWDAENRLIAAETSTNLVGTAVPAVRLEFAYDFQSRRVGKTVYAWTTNSTWAETSATTYLYDGWNVIRDIKSTASSLQTNSYTWGLDLSGSLQGAGGIGGLLAVVRPDPTNSLQPKAYLATYDGNGNVSEYVAPDEEIVAHFEYSPYGKAVVATGPLAAEFPIRFSTKFFDIETGLGYWGYRWYTLNLERWLSRDPIGERGGDNVYAFGINGPISAIDKHGLALVLLVPKSLDEITLENVPKRELGTRIINGVRYNRMGEDDSVFEIYCLCNCKSGNAGFGYYMRCIVVLTEKIVLDDDLTPSERKSTLSHEKDHATKIRGFVSGEMKTSIELYEKIKWPNPWACSKQSLEVENSKKDRFRTTASLERMSDQPK